MAEDVIKTDGQAVDEESAKSPDKFAALMDRFTKPDLQSIKDKSKTFLRRLMILLVKVVGGLAIVSILFFLGMYMGLFDIHTIKEQVGLEDDSPVHEYLDQVDEYSKTANGYFDGIGGFIGDGIDAATEYVPLAVDFVSQQYDKLTSEEPAAENGDPVVAEEAASGNAQNTPVTAVKDAKKPTESAAQLEAKQKEIEEQLQLAQAAEKKRVSKLARLYAQMKPEEASVILQDLDDYIIVQILNRMEEGQVAKIMAAFEPGRSAEITRLMYSGNPPVNRAR